MANVNADPLQARLARKRKRRKAGTVQDLSRVLWGAVARVAALVEDDTTELDLRAVHALSQVSSTYLKALEVGELEARLEALEAAQASPSRAAGMSPQAGPRLRGAA